MIYGAGYFVIGLNCENGISGVRFVIGDIFFSPLYKFPSEAETISSQKLMSGKKLNIVVKKKHKLQHIKSFF